MDCSKTHKLEQSKTSFSDHPLFNCTIKQLTRVWTIFLFSFSLEHTNDKASKLALCTINMTVFKSVIKKSDMRGITNWNCYNGGLHASLIVLIRVSPIKSLSLKLSKKRGVIACYYRSKHLSHTPLLWSFSAFVDWISPVVPLAVPLLPGSKVECHGHRLNFDLWLYSPSQKAVQFVPSELEGSPLL